ncbi:Putative protein of unknown function [Podospora comata]|uniref:NAD(P)-binding domain-containing protein n=1 Tax=Podospora comata TaxID=48703 RepID=A0ABY6S977_PODCO|nr:Putative protein of unknown function [Podospora comata]
MPVTTVGIAGITGRLARLITHHLLALSPTLTIKGYCRDLSKATSYPTLKNITITQGDPYDPTALRHFVSGCDVVICGFFGDPRLMTEGQKLLIEACEAEGVKRYVAGDWTLNYDKLEYGEHPQKDCQKRVKEFLQEDGRKVKGVHMLIGIFYETLWSDYFGVFRPGEGVGVVMRCWGTGEEVWEGLSYDDAARYSANVALDEEAVGVVTFLGDRKSTKQLAAEFEEVYGVAPRLDCLGTVEELQTKMEATREKEPQNIFAWLADNYQTYIMNGRTYVPTKLDNGRYPDVKPLTFKEFLQKHKVEELNGLYTKAAADL